MDLANALFLQYLSTLIFLHLKMHVWDLSILYVYTHVLFISVLYSFASYGFITIFL